MADKDKVIFYLQCHLVDVVEKVGVASRNAGSGHTYQDRAESMKDLTALTDERAALEAALEFIRVSYPEVKSQEVVSRLDNAMARLDVLKRARELLKNPESWTKGAEARDVEGKPSSGIVYRPDGTVAVIPQVSYSLSGAIYKSSQYDGTTDRLKLLTSVMSSLAIKGSIQRWNDEVIRTHSDVIGILDAAIECCQIKE